MFSPFKNLSTMPFVDVRLRDPVSDKNSGLCVGCNRKCSSKLFCFHKTFPSFEMYNIGEQKPQRHFLSPSVGRPLHFNEKKQITSQTITSLNLNGKVCNTALKTPPKLCHPRQIGTEKSSIAFHRTIDLTLLVLLRTSTW